MNHARFILTIGFSIVLALVSSESGCLVADDAILFFEDTFGPPSRGTLLRNTITDAPPAGMGYETYTPAGFVLKNWVIADAEADGPRKSFWVIPQRADGTVEAYAEQAGRSRKSIAFVRTPVPDHAYHYVIKFRQRAHDNDYIGFILGGSDPEIEHGGVEFGYERQLPLTDETTTDIYYQSPWGSGRIEDRALLREWVEHRIEVRGQHIRWSQNGEVMLAGSVETLKAGGWFGIKQRYERGTRYDDVRITILANKRAEQKSSPPPQ